jgi:putative phosphonate catabolism associated alcohol dehydrogenase
VLPKTGKVAVYDSPHAPFALREYPLRPPRGGEALVRVRMSTICRSDIHSYEGRRPNPCPGVLGHEIVGDVVALGEGVRRDLRGDPLAPGDRITWSEYFVPGPSYERDVLDLPQKSPGLDKYGHMAAATEPHFHGGFAEYCYVLPGSWILKVHPELTDEEATPLNCGVATMMAATEVAGIAVGHAVVFQGLGLLGLYGAAIAKGRGARLVVGIDPVPARRALAGRFGVDLALDPAALGDAALIDRVRERCRPNGADAVVEVCGAPEVIPAGVRMLRAGGTYALAGLVNPDARFTLDANLLVRGLIQLRGVHNYHPRHLVQALDFVAANRGRFPFRELVDGRYPLAEVGRAMRDAAELRVLRAAVVP